MIDLRLFRKTINLCMVKCRFITIFDVGGSQVTTSFAFSPLLSTPMNQKFFETIIGTNETGFFIGEGDCQIQFNQEEISALYFAQVHSNAIAESFVNYCRMTIASGSLPSCFRQDLSPDEIMELQEDLGEFRKKFADALFKISLIFEL